MKTTSESKKGVQIVALPTAMYLRLSPFGNVHRLSLWPNAASSAFSMKRSPGWRPRGTPALFQRAPGNRLRSCMQPLALPHERSAPLPGYRHALPPLLGGQERSAECAGRAGGEPLPRPPPPWRFSPRPTATSVSRGKNPVRQPAYPGVSVVGDDHQGKT